MNVSARPAFPTRLPIIHSLRYTAELHDWLTSEDMEWKAEQPCTGEMRFAMNRFFFTHYCQWFRNGGFAKAIASIPQVNMLDDHGMSLHSCA